jgi:hypothetical protein
MCFNGVLLVYIDSAKTSFFNTGFSHFLPAHRETPKMHKERPPLISLVYLESTLQHFTKILPFENGSSSPLGILSFVKLDIGFFSGMTGEKMKNKKCKVAVYTW